jgi:hypothetical protein
LEGARIVNREVIRGREKPLAESGGAGILNGTLAPARPWCSTADGEIHREVLRQNIAKYNRTQLLGCAVEAGRCTLWTS